MKVLVVYSGGLDSTCLMFEYLNAGHKVRALSVNYGQRHGKELEAAKNICAAFEIPHEVADLTALLPLLGGSSQTDPSIPVPEGHYTAETMKATVVPNRNMILLAVAAARCLSLKFDAVAYAAHSGDHAIYPDCRPIFVKSMKSSIALCDLRGIDLHAPYVFKTKAEIVKSGESNHVPFALTWSCYKGGTLHCGKCGTCVERIEAFQLAGVPDPTVYEPA